MCDAHVVKMILESCQLLSTHDRLNGLVENRYKSTHINHPCRKCLNNINNYIWLCKHLNALLTEYTYRYHKIHKCYDMFLKNWYKFVRQEIKFTNCTFPKCMPDECKISDDVTECYIKFYEYKSKVMKRFTYKMGLVA